MYLNDKLINIDKAITELMQFYANNIINESDFKKYEYIHNNKKYFTYKINIHASSNYYVFTLKQVTEKSKYKVESIKILFE